MRFGCCRTHLSCVSLIPRPHNGYVRPFTTLQQPGQPQRFSQTRVLSQSKNPTARSIRSFFSSSGPRRRTHTLRDSSSVTTEEDPAKYCPGGYHPVHLNETFNQRYKIVSKLGFGIYSTVWLAEDLTRQSSSTSPYVALKILTAESYGYSRPVFELEILQHIRQIETNHPGYKHVSHLLDSFIHQGPNGEHLCLVNELMGPSLMTLQRSCSQKQLPAHLARQIALQVLSALDWLNGPCGIIHTDIKPDNILLEIPNPDDAVQHHLDKLKKGESSENQSADSGLVSRPICCDVSSDPSDVGVKIVDFGVASWKDNHLNEWIQPPSLRAPEVFLGAPWDASVDVWSFACMIYELLQGRVLFRGRPGPNNTWTAEEDQIAQMIELFGTIPSSLRSRGKLSENYFDENGDLLHIKQLYPYSLRDLLQQTRNASMSERDYVKFEEFLQAVLRYEPSTRKTPKELLKTPWLSEDQP